VPQTHILSIPLITKGPADREKIKNALSALVPEDPNLGLRMDEDSGQIVLTGMSELQLETVVERMKREHRVEAEMGQPQVAFRESIRARAEGEGRYTRQTGAFGNYGHVKLRIEPDSESGGYAFINGIQGGVVPERYIRPIERGVQEAIQSGVLSGYPMVHIKVTLYDGSFHDLHSNELAFTIAGSIAFKDAARRAKPVVEAPIMWLQIRTPPECRDIVLGDLKARRSRIGDVETCGGDIQITATAPLAKLLGYASTLHGLSQGRATLLVEFKQYEAVPEKDDLTGEGPSPVPAVPRRPRPGSSQLQAGGDGPDADMGLSVQS